jgi:hypothetical protein
MRILFHVEPLVMHNRPFHYWAWLGRSATMARTLDGRGHSFRFLLNEALGARAAAPLRPGREDDPKSGHGIPPEWVVRVRQDEIRRHFNVPNVALLDGLHHGRWPSEKVAALGQAMRERLGDFVPGIIITFTPAPHLAAAYPGALVLHAENGMFSRAPFPGTQYFDPLGLYARSMLGVHARELLARKPTDDERAWLARVREGYRAWLLASSPFHGLEQSLRRRHRRLALLPLQFGGEAGFDMNGPFRNQGEYLLHVLERLPEGVGVIVTEHPTARWLGDDIDEETRRWVRARWPQVAWVDPGLVAHGSQMLMLHVDDVIGVSSSLALQSLFWRKPLTTVGWGLPRAYATHDGVENLDPARPVGTPADHDGAVAWMLQHYFVPESLCLRDAGWIERFLDTARDRQAQSRMGLDFYDPIAPDTVLEAAYAAPPPPATRATVDARLLRDGAFEEWAGSRGAERPSRWEFLPGLDATARVSAGSAADGPRVTGLGPLRPARIERAPGGAEPSLLLQRIPDVDALAGALVSVGFWARGTPGARLESWLFQQLDTPGAPAQGTPARPFALDGEWQRFAFTVSVPEAPAAPRGEKHHTELVFAVGPTQQEQCVEIAGVTLGPGVVGE